MAHFKYFLLFTLLVVLSSSSCEKRLSCSRNWEFEVPIDVSNRKDLYAVGDTLIFQSKFDNVYTDLGTGDQVIITEFPFEVNFILSKIDENPASWANQDFQLIPFGNQIDFIGISSDGRPGVAGAFRTLYIREEDQNLVRFGLVCSESGVFTIQFTAIAGLDRDRAKANFTKNCDDYISPFHFRMNDHGDNGFSLYNGSIDTTLHSVSREVYEKIGAYSFVVE